MMTDTMDHETEWDSEEKTSNALLCMLGLGVGEILGSLAFGRIIDKCSMNFTVLLNCLVVAVAFGFLILYGVQYKFSLPMALAMTTSWGVQDAGV